MYSVTKVFKPDSFLQFPCLELFGFQMHPHGQWQTSYSLRGRNFSGVLPPHTLLNWHEVNTLTPPPNSCLCLKHTLNKPRCNHDHHYCIVLHLIKGLYAQQYCVYICFCHTFYSSTEASNIAFQYHACIVYDLLLSHPWLRSIVRLRFLRPNTFSPLQSIL